MKLKNDIPKSATANKNTRALWKLCQELSLEEIKVLFLKRKNELKYEKDMKRIKELRTEIAILDDAYEIIKRQKGILYDDREIGETHREEEN